MVTGLLALFFSLAALTLVMSLVLTLHTWEHRRYARSCFQNRATARTAGRVAVIVPCKGVDFSLKDNLHRLLVQDYEDYEVHFVVELILKNVLLLVLEVHLRLLLFLKLSSLLVFCFLVFLAIPNSSLSFSLLSFIS